MRHWTVAAAAVLFTSPSFALQSPPAKPDPPVPYEAFCGKTRMEKQDMLRTMTADQKAALWQTQIDRWRDLNAASLTADQRALLQEFRAIIPAAVVRPIAPETEPRLRSLEGRLGAAFTREQQRELDNYGPCLPKK